MQIFEYYFNPKARGDRFFEIFSLEPAKDFSKGNVYFVGELANALPQNSGLLQKLGKIVSQEYSLHPTPVSQEAFFRALLKRANEFLQAELKVGNVDWLLNLHVALLLIKNSERKSFFAIAKSGTIQAFMTRGTNVVDLGKNIEGSSSQGREIFGSIASGMLSPQDKLLILTKDIHEALLKDQALSDLSVLSTEKQFQAFFQKKNKILFRVSGICFALLAEEFVPHTPPLFFLKKSMFSLKLPKLQIPSFAKGGLTPIGGSDPPKQKIMLVSALVLVLLGGFLLFQGERKELQRGAQTIVLQIQVIQKEAQSALALNDVRSANILFQEAWKKASSHTGKEVPFRETFIVLKEKLEQQLLSINNIHYIENPVALVDIQQEDTDLIPQNMVLAQGNLYLFNPFSSQIFIFDLQEREGKTVSDLKIIRLDVRTAEFGKNLYILNSQEGTIAKYEDPLNTSDTPILWMNEESLKKPMGAKSMAIDGNIWILTQDNMLQRYFGGFWQEDIKPLVFPLLKNATTLKAFPGLSYLYILDPSESRVVLLNKSGDLVKQYRIDVQEPLLDFTVSRSGNTLYLLAGSKVFQISE